MSTGRRRLALLTAALALLAPARGLVRAAEPAPIEAARSAIEYRLPQVGAIRAAPPAAPDDTSHPLEQDVRETLRAVIKAERLAAAGQMPRAAARFQRVLDSPGRDLLLPVGGGSHLPVWRYCTLRLLTGPPRLLAAYRSAYEEPARTLLTAAKARRERTSLHLLVRRYGATVSALGALDLLAGLELERGRPATAARVLSMRIAMTRGPLQDEAAALAKLAAALARAGRARELRRLRDVVARHHPKAVVRAGGRDVKLATFVQTLAAGVPEPAPPKNAGPAPRPATILWQVPFDAPRAADTRRVARGPVRVRLASPAPALRDGVLYCQGRSEMKAVDLATGQVFAAVSLGSVRARPQARPARAPSWGSGVVAPAFDENPLATRVILSFPTARSETGQLRRPRIVRTGRIDALGAAHGRRQTATIWSVNTLDRDAGPPDGRIDRSLRLASSPVTAEGVVCVGARLTQNESRSFLLGLDTQSGRQLWRTPVAVADWVDPDRLEQEHADGSRPAVRNGVATYCGDLGSIAAVDLADGSVLWLTQYPRETPMLCSLTTIGGQRATMTAPPNQPIVSGDTVFALPADSKHVLALDAATGRVKWRRERTHGDAVALHLLAADDKRVYLAGTAVLCLDARTGALLWRSVLFDSFPVGRGVVARDHVMVPIEGGIAMVEIGATGRLDEPIRWRNWRRHNVRSGNLMLLDDRLVVARDDSLTLFGSATWERKVGERATREPKEPRHHVDLGVLHAGRGDWPRAATALERARELLAARQLPADAVEDLLARTYRRLATQFEAGRRWADASRVLGRALALEQESRPRAALLLLRRARALEKAGDIRAALAALHDVLARFPDTIVRPPGGFLPGQKGAAARADMLAALRITRLNRSHTENVYAPYEAAADAAEEALKAAGDDRRDGLRRIARTWPNSGVAAAFRLDEARRAIAAGRFAAAAGELLAVERLAVGRHADAVKTLRAELLAAREKRRVRPPVAEPGREPRIVWRTALPAMRCNKESAADAAAVEAGQDTGRHLLFTDGKSLKAYNLADGRVAWDTGSGWLGVRFQSPTAIPPGAPRAALEFVDVLPEQPAEKAGVKPGDLLLAFDGEPIRQREDLVQLCGTTAPGKKVGLEVFRDGRRLKLRAVIGRRPEGPNAPYNIRPPAPQEYVRVIGLEGEHLIADVDLALLWINRQSGHIDRRTVIAPYPTGLDSSRAFLYGIVREREMDRITRRGLAPALVDGAIVAPAPGGAIECFDLSGRRRWSARAAGPAGAGPRPWRAVVRLEPLRGKVAAIVAVAAGGGLVRHDLVTHDILSGGMLHRTELVSLRRLMRIPLLSVGDTLVVPLPPTPNAAGGQLVALDAGTGKDFWRWPARRAARAGARRDRFHETAIAGDKVVTAVGDAELVALDLKSGAVTWRSAFDGAIRKVVRGGESVFVAHNSRTKDGRRAAAVTRVRLADGKRLWRRVVVRDAQFHHTDPIPFAAVSGGRLVFVQHLVDRRGLQLGRPTVAVLRTSDGALAAMIGMGQQGRYNVQGGKWAPAGRRTHGVIGLITQKGLIGLSFDPR